jgi:VWFA-related protein
VEGNALKSPNARAGYIFNQLSRVPRLFVSFAGVIVFTHAITAQERVSIEPHTTARSTNRDLLDRDSANIRVTSDLVLIPVTVTDGLNRFVTGLGKDYFRLYEDKIEQVITHFASEDAPVSVGIVFDCSGSMGEKLRRSREAVTQFLKSANPEDEFSLVEFADHAALTVRLTQQSQEIQNRLTFVQSKGKTALLDAIALAMSEMKRSHNPRKALLIISDGGDNSSRYTVSEIRSYVREADVQIFAIGILEPPSDRTRTPEELAGPQLLGNIAQQTGGRLFEVDRPSELPGIASEIGMALRNQYVLGYTPSSVRQDGKYHHIRLTINKPKGWPTLKAYWRLGYYDRGQ